MDVCITHQLEMYICYPDIRLNKLIVNVLRNRCSTNKKVKVCIDPKTGIASKNSVKRKVAGAEQTSLLQATKLIPSGYWFQRYLYNL